MTSISQILEAWAQWRAHPWKVAHLGYGKTVLARMLDGMPGTFCPYCAGKGKRDGDTCPQCSGLGRIKLDPSSTRLKINPAFIVSTHLPEDNPLFYVVDRAVAGLPKQQYKAVMSEYVWHISEPDQRRRAKRLRLSYSNFKKSLERGRGTVEQHLKDNRFSLSSPL